jgi:hypothetical protein
MEPSEVTKLYDKLYSDHKKRFAKTEEEITKIMDIFRSLI